jgi:HD-like signal output (HDOD) protein
LQQGGGLAFTAGMFCEIGQIVLDVCIPRQFSELLDKQSDSKLSLTELERAEFGFDHFDIGADLLHQWNFPLEIEQLVRNLNKHDAQAKFDPLLCVINIAMLVEQNVTGEELITKLSQINCSEMKLTWEEIKDNLPASEDLENLYLNVK